MLKKLYHLIITKVSQKYKHGIYQGSTPKFREVNAKMQKILPVLTWDDYTRLTILQSQLAGLLQTYEDARIVDNYNIILMTSKRRLKRENHYT